MSLSFEDEMTRIAVVKNTVIGVWFDAPTLVRLKALDDARRAAHAASPKGAGLMNVIVGGKPNFSSEVRAEVKRQGETPHGKELGAAQVVLVPGLTGTAVRAFLTGTLLFAKNAEQRKVFASMPDAARWAAPLWSIPGVSWTPAEIEDVVRALQEPK